VLDKRARVLVSLKRAAQDAVRWYLFGWKVAPESE
jgi:hypothetical protein